MNRGCIKSVSMVVFLFLVAQSAIAQHGTVSTVGTGTAGVEIKSDAPFPDVTVQTGNTSTGTFRILDSANVELLRVGNGGSVSVGAIGAFGVGGAAPAGYQFYATTALNGTPTAFQLRSSYDETSRSYFGNFGVYGTYISTNRDPKDGAMYEAAASDPTLAAQVMIGDTRRSRMFQVVNYAPLETVRFVVKYDGRVGIGTAFPSALLHVAGDVVVDGNIGAKYQDVAEWVPASTDLQPGTVVVLNPNRDNEVMSSARAYDTTVAGVVSAQPGLVLGEGSATKETVATMGRVRVKVDARRAPIAIGDLLVTSDRPGYAMKSVPVDMGGTPIHRPGTIIGKALQPLAGGEGEILVLLSLQ